MPKRLRRLPPTLETREKLSASLKGHVTSDETKEKIRASLLGRKHSEKAKEKMRLKRKLRPRKTDQMDLTQCRAAVKKRKAEAEEVRFDQWRADMRIAYGYESWDLYWDVKHSGGWRSKRKMFDGTGKVSNGFRFTGRLAGKGEIVWPALRPI